MGISYDAIDKKELSAQIADQIREAILGGKLVVRERLPGEEELAERFGVSRPTVREALKRLAAQNLIRSRRGPKGGAFVHQLSWSEAHESLVTTSRLLVSMNPIDPRDIVEARASMEKACLPFACARREARHLETMRKEIVAQRSGGISDEAFCDSDVRFHRALVDAAGNPMLSFQMAGAIEAMQPLLNMITFRSRDRKEIAGAHDLLVDALESRGANSAAEQIDRLADYTLKLIEAAQSRRAASHAEKIQTRNSL
ncbi:MAG: GntR family transcriptional regulator [Pseudomonadota bacterium]